MPYDAREISNFFLGCAEDEGGSLTPMTLLKVLYFAHAWYLVKFDKPLVGQPFEAWKYGPVNRVVYDQIKKFRSLGISGKLVKFDPLLCDFCEVLPKLSSSDEKLLRDIYRYYSKFSAFELSDLTHEKGGPWDVVWTTAEQKAVPGMCIPDELIKEWHKNTGGRLRSAEVN